MRDFALPRLWLGIWMLGWLLCIALSLMHPPQLGVDVPDGDKLGHFLAYALLSAWAVWLFQAPRHHRRAALALFALGVAIELGQGEFTLDRTMDGWDALADGIGVLAGWWLGLRTPAFLQRLERKIGQST